MSGPRIAPGSNCGRKTCPYFGQPHPTPAGSKSGPGCNGHSKQRDGAPCQAKPIPGGFVCKHHGGATQRVQAAAAVRAELRTWGLNDTADDPGEVLLRLVTQSRMRCELYADLLQRAFDAAERARERERDDHPGHEYDYDADERRELDEVLQRGGVAALVGKVYSGVKDGEGYAVIATGEALRGLAKLEADERERCATFAAKAVAAGLMERQVRLAEQQGAMVVKVILDVLQGLDLTPEQQAAGREIAQRKLYAIAGGKT